METSTEHVIPREHIVPPKVYVTIFIVLMVMTAVTVWIAFFDLGPLNVIMALAIAVFKATLVILYFMHVRYSSKLTQIIVACGVLWFLLLLGLTLQDYLTRGWDALLN